MFTELIYIITAFIFLLYYSGIGLTRLIIPERFREYEILVIPFIGLSILLFFAHIFSFLGYGSKVFTWPIILLVTPLNIYALKKMGVPRLNISETFPILSISVVVFTVGMIPLFREGYLTTIGTGSDAVIYTIFADHFLENGLFESPKGKGIWFTNLIPAVQGASRMGPMYVQSMVGALTGLEGYKTFTVLTNLFNPMLLISAYLFTRGTGLLSKRGSLFAASLLGINSSLYWAPISGFSAHIMTRSIIPLALTASLYMLTNRDRKSLSFSVAICSAILMTTPEAIVLVLAPLFFFAVIKAFKKEVLPAEAVKISALWGLLLAIINILPMIPSFKWLYVLLSTGFKTGFHASNIGNIPYFTPLTQVFGFTPPHHYSYREVIHSFASPAYLTYFYTSYAAVFIVSLLAGYAILRTDRQRQAILLSISAPYLLIALWMRFTFHYGYFKIASFSSFLIAVLIAVGIGMVFTGSFTRALKMLIMPVVALIMLLSLTGSYLLLDMVVDDKNEEWITVSKELLALKGIQRYIKKDEPIFLYEGLGRGDKYFWIAYLMQDREVWTTRGLPATEQFREKGLESSYVVYPIYIRIKSAPYDFVPAEVSDGYRQYMRDGWTMLMRTSDYILLGKRKGFKEGL